MNPVIFDYTAIDPQSGGEIHGQETAADANAAATALRGRGLVPVAVTPAAVERHPEEVLAESKRRSSWIRRRAVGPRELRTFTRQLATLVKAGVPLARALHVIGVHDAHQGVRRLADELRIGIESGGTLSEGLRRRGEVFDDTYVAMVTAGETGGVLSDILSRQALVLEKHERVRGRLRTALAYPAVVLVVAALIVAVLVTVVVPKFALIYGGLLRGQPLPTLTSGLLALSHFLRANVLLGVMLAAIAVWMGRRWRRTERGRRLFDRWQLGVPWLGDLLLKAAVARVAGLLGALLESGVPEMEALAIAEGASGNTRISAALAEVAMRLRRGEGIAGPLERTGVFPGLVAGMVRVGEETGALPEMFRRVAEAYDDEVDQAVAALAAVIEPMLIVGMALIVGIIVIALFLPMAGVLQHLQ
ncbi:MAG: type II secretion system F family protein [Verrucomicrobia bacterium]|nr:type II secretion system F family protein [Verrucomicrobiota bacterium]